MQGVRQCRRVRFHVGTEVFNLGAVSLQSNNRTISWSSTGLTWAAGDMVFLQIVKNDTTAPTLTGARMTTAAKLQLLYNETLDAGSVPARTAFSVSVAG